MSSAFGACHRRYPHFVTPRARDLAFRGPRFGTGASACGAPGRDAEAASRQF
jgi:hypothetical protein